MIDALASPYVAQARRYGISGVRIQYGHALPDAIAPAAQQLARTVGLLPCGVIVVESLYVIPGLGTVLMNAVAERDVPVVQGLLMRPVDVLLAVPSLLLIFLVAAVFSPGAVGLSLLVALVNFPDAARIVRAAAAEAASPRPSKRCACRRCGPCHRYFGTSPAGVPHIRFAGRPRFR